MVLNRTGPLFCQVFPEAPFLDHSCFAIINDITEDIDSELRLFADNCVCYHEIKNREDTMKLQVGKTIWSVGQGVGV